MSECRSCAIDLGSLQTDARVRVDRQPFLLTHEFTFVWWSQVISQIGDGITKLALLWLVYSVTGSPMKTTMIGMLQTIPPILFGPLIGVCLDRLPKKPILIGINLVHAVLIGILPFCVGLDTFNLERLYLLVFLNAIATSVSGPALTTSVPSLVGRSQFTAANALLQSTTSLGAVVGSILSGVGIAAFSSQAVLGASAVTYFISAACLAPARFSNVRTSPTAGRPTSVLSDLIEGVRFAFMQQHAVSLLIITATLYSFGISAFSTLFPVIGKTMLDLGPIEVGYLWSAFGVGLFMVSVGLVRVTRWTLRQRVLGIAGSCLVSGLALSGLLWASDRVMATIFMIIIGGGVGVFTPIAWGLLQELSPEHMLGRALTLYGTGAMVAAMTGMTAFGWVMQEFGERASVVGIILVMFATALMAAGFSQWIHSQQRALSRVRVSAH